jgi:hypothetical protein
MDAGMVIRPLQAKLDEVKADGLDVMLCSTEIIENVISLLKEQDNEIDTLKTLLLGYETGAIKCNNDALTQEGR